MKGLRLDVCRPADGTDCTNGGISSRHTTITVVGIVDEDGAAPTWLPVPTRAQVHVATDDAPAVWLRVRTGLRAGDRAWSIVPAGNADPTHSRALRLQLNGWAMGGNYAATSDPRLREITGSPTPVAVHDRRER